MSYQSGHDSDNCSLLYEKFKSDKVCFITLAMSWVVYYREFIDCGESFLRKCSKLTVLCHILALREN